MLRLGGPHDHVEEQMTMIDSAHGVQTAGHRRLTRRQVGKLAAAGLGTAALAHLPGVPSALAENGPIARTWYFAEGYTGPGFDEHLTIQNPNGGPATVDITQLPRGCRGYHQDDHGRCQHAGDSDGA
jgi:hypothetical protein